MGHGRWAGTWLDGERTHEGALLPAPLHGRLSPAGAGSAATCSTDASLPVTGARPSPLHPAAAGTQAQDRCYEAAEELMEGLRNPAYAKVGGLRGCTVGRWAVLWRAPGRDASRACSWPLLWSQCTLLLWGQCTLPVPLGEVHPAPLRAVHPVPDGTHDCCCSAHRGDQLPPTAPNCQASSR